MGEDRHPAKLQLGIVKPFWVLPHPNFAPKIHAAPAHQTTRLLLRRSKRNSCKVPSSMDFQHRSCQSTWVQVERSHGIWGFYGLLAPLCAFVQVWNTVFHRNWRCPKNAGTHEKSWIFIGLAMIFHEINHPFYGFHHKPSSYVPQALVATGKLPCQARWVGELPMDVSYKCRSIRGLVTYLVGGLEHLV